MRFLLVGNGAREHAIAEALCRNREVKLFAFMSARNPGIAKLCERSKGAFAIGDIHSPKAVSDWAVSQKIELAFASPDAVLEAGVSDALIAAGITTASPVKEAARLEWDKSFCRNLMKKHWIRGCPKFGIFKDAEAAAKFIDELKEVAVKPSGLTGGKGVKVTGYQLKDADEAKKYTEEVLKTNMGGLGEVVIEERLFGEEFTLQAFVDGKSVVGMPAVQDHKRAYKGDEGPNTGGMGSYTGAGHLLPFITQKDYDDALQIMRSTISAFREETGKEFKGVLYGQFIAGKNGVEVIEYNSRFGDPEAMNVLALLESDLAEVFTKMARGGLKEGDVKFAKKATVCKYLVPEGYPIKSVKDQPLQIDEDAITKAGAHLYYASVDEREGIVYTGSSRSIGVLGIGPSISDAERKAEAACSFVKGRVWHREDIGTDALVQKRVEHMKELRGK